MSKRRFPAKLALAVLLIGGCARAYHDYPCGCVPYGYCLPSPLPHRPYCGCPTPIAAGRAAQPPPPRQEAEQTLFPLSSQRRPIASRQR